MTGNKKVKCNVCYREMRSDTVKRHMKQHTKKNESNPVTNISVTNNYNTISGVSTERKDEENENKDEELKEHLIKIENEYQEKLPGVPQKALPEIRVFFHKKLSFLSKVKENDFYKSNRPKCSSSVEMIKHSKHYFCRESETNG